MSKRINVDQVLVELLVELDDENEILYAQGQKARAAIRELVAAAEDVHERGTDSPEHNRLHAALAAVGSMS